MTINSRNHRRRKLAETAARLTRYTDPSNTETHAMYQARLHRARCYYTRLGVPALQVEIEYARRAIRRGQVLKLPAAIA